MVDFWSDKTIVVTGAAQGQGAAEAIALFDLGATVIALDIATVEDARWDVLKSHAAHAPQRMCIRQLNVAQTSEWEELVASLNAEGTRLHGLINNAGVTLRKTVRQTSPEEWRKLLAINLDGAFFGIHYLAPLMNDGSSIVNISSCAGMTGYFAAAYSTSKWALRGLTRAAAQDLAERSIRVNTICPGLVETPMIHAANTVHDLEKAKLFHEGNRQATLLSRGASPEEIASVAVFLLGPGSTFITATDIPVDGGMTGGGIYWRIGQMTGNL